MILIDANLLLYAYNKSSDAHPRARAWLEDNIGKAGAGSVFVGDPAGLFTHYHQSANFSRFL